MPGPNPHEWFARGRELREQLASARETTSRVESTLRTHENNGPRCTIRPNFYAHVNLDGIVSVRGPYGEVITLNRDEMLMFAAWAIETLSEPPMRVSYNKQQRRIVLE